MQCGERKKEEIEKQRKEKKERQQAGRGHSISKKGLGLWQPSQNPAAVTKHCGKTTSKDAEKQGKST